MSDPLFSDASTTTTARLNPLMMRFLRGKCRGSGLAPGGNSLMTLPAAWMAAMSSRCSRGIGHVGPIPENSHGPASGIEGPTMGGAVDATGQSTDDRDAGRGKLGT